MVDVRAGFEKALAVALLLIVLSMALTFVWFYLDARLQLSEEARVTAANIDQLRSRRIDMVSLNDKLSQLVSSKPFLESAIDAQTDKAATARLLLVAREVVEKASGRLLSSIPTNLSSSAETVTVLIRARMSEDALPSFLEAAEQGIPRLALDDVTLVTRSSDQKSASDLEVTASLRATWSRGMAAK